ncbi:hypothetical protein FSP39_015812 [Pinctada imbricata]|uniref:Lupus La protein n=1 Tax=Pinctada imbricata TaxID=66713 RepID=A0AA89BUV4_PINIB|nr:hypothetical protein FSP39_015812 [Pinctada imbricata]
MQEKEKENGGVNNAVENNAVKEEVKEEVKLGPPNGLEKKIIKQIEYYFGDVNLPRDRFLQDALKEEDGWVSLATMTKFNRLKQLTTNHKIIATALRKSDSGLIQVSKDNIFIRRNPERPVPENTEERRNEINARTAYVKGFPENITLDKLIQFFNAISPIDTVFMRRDQEKKFKGSVFVTFCEQSSCDSFLAGEDVKYDDVVLARKPRNEYFKLKEEEKKIRKLEQLRRKKEEMQRREAEERQKVMDTLTPGAILHLTGITSEEVTMDDFKNYFSDYASVKWVDFNKGDNQAWLRFEEANKASEAHKAALEAHDNKLEIGGCVVEGRVLEGEEEIDHWRKLFKERAERLADIKKKKRQSRDRRGGPRRKKRRDDRDDKKDDDDEEDDDDDDDDDDDKEDGDEGDDAGDVKEEPAKDD